MAIASVDFYLLFTCFYIQNRTVLIKILKNLKLYKYNKYQAKLNRSWERKELVKAIIYGEN